MTARLLARRSRITVSKPISAFPSTVTYDFNTSGLNPSYVEGSAMSAGALSNGSLATFQVALLTYANNVLQTNPATGATSAALAHTNNSYFQVTLTPNQALTVSQVAFKAARGGASTPRGWSLRYSGDSYGSIIDSADIPTQRTTLTQYTVALSSLLTNISSPVTFRFYVHAPTNGSSVDFEDIVFTAVVPVPASALLIEAGTPWLLETGGYWLIESSEASNHVVVAVGSSTGVRKGTEASNHTGVAVGSSTDTYTPAAGAWTPAQQTGLHSWYDPTDAANRTIVDNAFSALVNKEGTTARNLSQGTAGQRPASTSTINGLTVMSFDGSNDFMGTGNTGAGLYASSDGLMVATVISGASQDDRHTIQESDAGASNFFSYLRSRLTNSGGTAGAPDAYGQIDGGNVIYGSSNNGTIAAWNSTANVVVVSLGAGAMASTVNYEWWVNGTSSHTASFTKKSTTFTHFTLGTLRFLNGTFTWFNGLMAEVVTAKGANHLNDRQKLEGYLAHRYGIQSKLPSGHPYKNSPP